MYSNDKGEEVYFMKFSYYLPERIYSRFKSEEVIKYTFLFL
jgi:hypothetical protein